MRYLKKLKKSTRRTRFLLALLTLLFGFSANAATHIVSDKPVDPSTLDDGAKVVMYHNSTGQFVGCNGGNEVTKDKKEITDDDAKYYVFTVTKDGKKLPFRMVPAMCHRLQVQEGIIMLSHLNSLGKQV